MYPHEKPDFDYNVDVQRELGYLEEHRQLPDRKIPVPDSTNVTLATWNLTNFGVQKREESHLELMADIIKPFDIVAIQEVADDLSDFTTLLSKLGNKWDFLCSDVAGNQERLGFLYRADRVEPTGLAAELAMRGYQRAKIVIEGIDPEEDPFTGFNRNPYMVSFKAGDFEFNVVNVHLYWSNMALRRLEANALARWAHLRKDKLGPPNNDIVLIGDFNMPHARPGDKIYDELEQYGLSIPKHTTDLVGTNLAGDRHYDELAFFPSKTGQDFTYEMGVFDFDNALFRDLWEQASAENNQERFFQYIRYYIADHRPFWAEFKR